MKAPTPATNPARAGNNRLAVALLCLPSLVLLGVRYVAPMPGPASASAATVPETDGLIALPPARAFSPAQDELAKIMTAQLAAGFGPSPVVVRQTEAAELPPMPGPTPETPTPRVEEAVLPSLTVSSIMSARGNPVAVIAGRMRRAGDEVAPGWKISAIDPHAKAITFAHTSGKTAVVTLNQR